MQEFTPTPSSSATESSSFRHQRAFSTASSIALSAGELHASRAARAWSERPATPPIPRAGGARRAGTHGPTRSVVAFSTPKPFVFGSTLPSDPTPTMGSDTTMHARAQLSPDQETRTRTQHRGLLGALAALASPIPAPRKKRSRPPMSLLDRVILLAFLAALAFFLRALSGGGVDVEAFTNTHMRPADGDRGDRVRVRSGPRAAYAAFQKAQEAAAHLAVDPEGHFTYSFASDSTSYPWTRADSGIGGEAQTGLGSGPTADGFSVGEDGRTGADAFDVPLTLVTPNEGGPGKDMQSETDGADTVAVSLPSSSISQSDGAEAAASFLVEPSTSGHSVAFLDAHYHGGQGRQKHKWMQTREQADVAA